MSVKVKLGSHGVVEIYVPVGDYRVSFHRKWFENGFVKNCTTLYDKRKALGILFRAVTGEESGDEQIALLIDLAIKATNEILKD